MSLLDTLWRRTRSARELQQRLDRIEAQLKHNMATTNERLTKIEADLTEGLGEVNAEIAKLREQIGADNLSPEAAATLLRIEAQAAALKDIIPNAPPA